MGRYKNRKYRLEKTKKSPSSCFAVRKAPGGAHPPGVLLRYYTRFALFCIAVKEFDRFVCLVGDGKKDVIAVSDQLIVLH